MKRVMMLMVARNVGGLERRFSTFYAYCAQNKLRYQLEFVVSRALTERLPSSFPLAIGTGSMLVKFGLPVELSKASRKLEFVWRFMDYLDLLRILLTRYRLRRLDAIHFVTPSSLFFRPAVRAKRYIVSSVDSTGKSRGYLFRSALNKGFHVDNLSRAIADEILNEGISDADHLHVTPCSFTNIEAARVGDKKPVVVFSGRFVPGKGLELLLKALPQLFNKCPQVKVEILGQGPLEKEINQYLKGRSWSNNVRVAFEDEPFDVLKHSIIFLSLQDLENYPSQSLLEAMVCGNAVVATDVGMTRDIVDEKVGILIQPQAESLVQAIEKMLSDFDQTVRMGQNARQRVLEKHTVEKFARYLENIYVEDDHG